MHRQQGAGFQIMVSLLAAVSLAFLVSPGTSAGVTPVPENTLNFQISNQVYSHGAPNPASYLLFLRYKSFSLNDNAGATLPEKETGWNSVPLSGLQTAVIPKYKAFSFQVINGLDTVFKLLNGQACQSLDISPPASALV